MSKRHLNKQAARIAHAFRWELVHAAGCIYRGEEHCPSLYSVRERLEVVNQDHVDGFARIGARPRRVSVPRSLRKQLGRWVGA